MKTRLLAIAVLAGAVSAANAAVLWYNNCHTNGVSGRAVSPPLFPDIRVVDDIVVQSPGWVIQRMCFNILHDVNWNPGDTIEVYLYNSDGNGGAPRTLKTTWTFGQDCWLAIDTGDSYSGRPDYFHLIDCSNDPIRFCEPGTYWIGLRHPNATGSGTGYWMTSNGGAHRNTPGYYSINGGTTWEPEGAGWDHAFVIEGYLCPEPGTLLAIGAGLAALAARRRK